ncbi:MAG TPA: hypothetical protein VEC38_03210 [Candidatus Binataceae bacterium]|nr:hypothetical protein [Candidatus Binataceae bacterium]
MKILDPVQIRINDTGAGSEPYPIAGCLRLSMTNYAQINVLMDVDVQTKCSRAAALERHNIAQGRLSPPVRGLLIEWENGNGG